MLTSLQSQPPNNDACNLGNTYALPALGVWGCSKELSVRAVPYVVAILATPRRDCDVLVRFMLQATFVGQSGLQYFTPSIEPPVAPHPTICDWSKIYKLLNDRFTYKVGAAMLTFMSESPPRLPSGTVSYSSPKLCCIHFGECNLHRNGLLWYLRIPINEKRAMPG